MKSARPGAPHPGSKFMFNLFRKRNSEPPRVELRDTLFGDLPLSRWPPDHSSADAEPWASFVAAGRALESNDAAAASASLRRVLSTPGLESRHYLQAWHHLRAAGGRPADADAKRVYGVVVEVAMPDGLDLLAAYEDGTARYYNYSGAGVIWERPDASLDAQVAELLEAGRVLVTQIGPWEKERPPAPQGGDVRVSLLTPSGLHFGQGSFDTLASDELGAPIIAAATRLMQALIAKSEGGRAS